MLRFHARPGHVLSWPGMKFAGQFARYVGRSTKLERDASGAVIAISHPAIAEAVEVDPQSKDKAQRDRAARLLRLMAIEVEKPLLPADEATAKAVGVKYEPVELRDGEWLPKSAPKISPSKEPNQ
jgi:hypothetical protein